MEGADELDSEQDDDDLEDEDEYIDDLERELGEGVLVEEKVDHPAGFSFVPGKEDDVTATQSTTSGKEKFAQSQSTPSSSDPDYETVTIIFVFTFTILF